MIRRERQEQADNFVNPRRVLRPDEYLPVRPGIASQVEATQSLDGCDPAVA